MLPEIEIVQMIYHTPAELSTVYNFEEEYRPKLYKRLRAFTWIDQIHETLRIDPVVYDSDIIVEHRPLTNHATRDFKAFERIAADGKRFSKKLHHMYAMELFRSGEDKDFLKAERLFKRTLEEDGRSIDEVKEPNTGKTFRLLNIPFYYVGVLNKVIEKITRYLPHIMSGKIDELMMQEEVYTNSVKCQELAKEKAANEAELEELYEKWEELAE